MLFCLCLFYFDRHIILVAEGGVWLAVTKGGEGGDMQSQGLGVGDQPLTLEVRVHLDLQYEDMYLCFVYTFLDSTCRTVGLILA